jgi:hypothetical protein
MSVGEQMSPLAEAKGESLLRFFTLDLQHVPATVEPPLTSNLHCVAFTRDGLTLVGAGAGRSCDISIWRVQFRLAASAAADEPPRLVFALSDHCVYENAHGGAPVRSLTPSPDDERIISGGADGCCRLWILKMACGAERLQGEAASDGESAPPKTMFIRLGEAIEGAHGMLAVNATVFTADGALLFTGGGDGALRSWPAEWCLRADGMIHRFEPPLLTTAEHTLPRARGSIGGLTHGSRAHSAHGHSLHAPSGHHTHTHSAHTHTHISSQSHLSERYETVCETLFLGEDPQFKQADAPPRISQAALELSFGSEAVQHWLEDEGHVLMGRHAAAPPYGVDDAEDSASEPFADMHVTDSFWHEMMLLWPTRLAANAHLLVLKAVATSNHEALRQLLYVNAACDWGNPFAILSMHSCSPTGERTGPEISALHLAIARTDGHSVRLILRYMVKIKQKSHSLSTVLHVSDLLLLLNRFPFMLAQFLQALGLEAVHPGISESCRRAPVTTSKGLSWSTRALRASLPALDALAELIGWRQRVPAGSFITRSHAERDPPEVWHGMAVLREEETVAAPTVALRVGIRDVLACRELLPLMAHSRASSELLRTPAAIALIDSKWHSYAARMWLLEAAVLVLYLIFDLLFLTLSPFSDEDELQVFRGRVPLHRISAIVSFAAKLIVVINALFVLRELLVWRLTARLTGTSFSYLCVRRCARPPVPVRFWRDAPCLARELCCVAPLADRARTARRSRTHRRLSSTAHHQSHAHSCSCRARTVLPRLPTSLPRPPSCMPHRPPRARSLRTCGILSTGG